MNLILKHIKLHGFLSFGDAEVDLQDRGYCSIVGINKNPKDGAISNGSGKSSIVSAICWAICGETIQGLSKNIANIYLNDGCFVQLDFDVDNIPYSITRYRDYGKIGNNLKIIINGEDKSGKTLKDGEDILKQYLPDLTSELLGSVIILGQGLPHRFSDNTPSGRKEVLEKLSKSDFMIEDIKNKITNRLTTLNNELRTLEDNNLKTKTIIDSSKTSLQTKEEYKANAVSPDYKQIIENLQRELDIFNTNLNEIKSKITSLEKDLEDKSALYEQELTKKNQDLSEELGAYNTKRDSLIKDKLELESQIRALTQEIDRLKSIKDVCPTCGQKIPGAVKPDTSKQEEELTKLQGMLVVKNQEVDSCNATHLTYTSEINKEHDSIINELKTSINTLKSEINTNNSLVRVTNDSITSTTRRLNQAIVERDNEEKNWKALLDEIEQLKKTIEDNEKVLENGLKEVTKTNEHLDVVKKMDTYVKRDFRGFLLQHLIKYIDAKAKEYCQEVFGTQELKFELNGNNIDISYCGKDFSNLSGGEKQKVDLILQFSLRDLMKQYLNFSCNCLFVDEIFDAMDSSGCDNMLNLITKKLTDVGSLFIISHRGGALGIPNDDTITIEKDENGISRII